MRLMHLAPSELLGFLSRACNGGNCFFYTIHTYCMLVLVATFMENIKVHAVNQLVLNCRICKVGNLFTHVRTPYSVQQILRESWNTTIGHVGHHFHGKKKWNEHISKNSGNGSITPTHKQMWVKCPYASVDCLLMSVPYPFWEPNSLTNWPSWDYPVCSLLP